jgi:Holliday junction DNA helicase RuvA
LFYSLTGTVVHREDAMVAIDCGGVAYACAVTAHTVGKLAAGERATLFTHLLTRDDLVELFGFATRGELDAFRRLIGVTGVGPKAALAVLSAFTPEQLALALAAGDAKAITRAQGVGAKLAQRILLELKDKLGAFGVPGGGGAPALGNAALPGGGEALEALVALGYAPAEAAMALRGLEEALPTQEKIRQALRVLAG